MSETLTSPGDDGASESGATAGAEPHAKRKAMIVGSATLGFALVGALLGAAAFSASSGSSPKAGVSSDRLTTSSTKMPLVTGSLCGSTKNTATAADTHLSCEDYGVSSFVAGISRSDRALGSDIDPAALLSKEGTGSSSTGSKSTKKGSTGSTSVKTSSPSTSALPTTGSAKSKATCESTPSGTGLPVSASVSASGDGGSVSVKSGSKGTTVCAKAPSAPSVTVPSVTVPTVTVPSATGSTGTATPAKKTKKKHHKKHKSAPVQQVINDVTGGLGGI